MAGRARMHAAAGLALHVTCMRLHEEEGSSLFMGGNWKLVKPRKEGASCMHDLSTRTLLPRAREAARPSSDSAAASH